MEHGFSGHRLTISDLQRQGNFDGHIFDENETFHAPIFELSAPFCELISEATL
jgi:hypothetical protein